VGLLNDRAAFASQLDRQRILIDLLEEAVAKRVAHPICASNGLLSHLIEPFPFLFAVHLRLSAFICGQRLSP
jgi:hypothetical protein